MKERRSPAGAAPPGEGSSPSRQKDRKCPICGKPATAESRPFCSSRCAKIDLNRWLSGTYVIPGRPTDPEGTEE